MNHFETITLAESDFIKIIKCNVCHRITIIHEHHMLGFSVEGFNQFIIDMENVEFDRCRVTYPDGIDRFIMNTGIVGMKLAFTREELNALQESLGHASCMMEVTEILSVY